MGCLAGQSIPIIYCLDNGSLFADLKRKSSLYGTSIPVLLSLQATAPEPEKAAKPAAGKGKKAAKSTGGKSKKTAKK